MSSMEQIEAQYLSKTGMDRVHDRNRFKLFYSHLHAFPAMVLGLNPGGDPADPGLVHGASDRLYDRYEHDYLFYRNDSWYALARPMSHFLSEVMGTRRVDVLRQIPVSNVVFRRSAASESKGQTFRNLHGMTLRDAFNKENDTLKQMVARVNPSVLFLVSPAAWELYKRLCSDVQVDAPITVANGSNRSRIFFKATAVMPFLGAERRTLLVTGHPSKFATRPEWADVIRECRRECERIGVAPLEAHPAIRKIPALDGYGEFV